MQLLRFNGFDGGTGHDVDIDDSTVIGIDIQSYDIKEPGERKVNISNTFTIPKTSKNMNIIGFAGDPQSDNSICYAPLKCEYWYDNIKMVDGKCYITEIGDRISIYMYNKPDFWTILDIAKWEPNSGYTSDQTLELTPVQEQLIVDGVQKSLLNWLQSKYLLHSISNKYVGTLVDLVNKINTDDILVLPHYIGNLGGYRQSETTPYVETTSDLYLSYTTGSTLINGGHFCIFAKNIFEYIEDTFDVNFSATKTGETFYNIFEDDYAKRIVIPLRNIILKGDESGWYFDINYTEKKCFLPLTDTYSYAGKTLKDFSNSFFKYFNCLLDTNDYITSTYKYSDKYNVNVRRFDDIIYAEEVDFSGDFSGDYKFKPSCGSNYKQKNYITLSNVYAGGSKTDSIIKFIPCNNFNLDLGGTDSILFNIDSFKNDFFDLGDKVTPDLTKSESLKTFSFFILDDNYNHTCNVNSNGYHCVSNLRVAQLYDFQGEYNTLKNMVDKPVTYEIDKWLNLNDIYKLKFFRKYFIEELNGYYFINKISGFNPKRSVAPTKLELIKINI